MAPTHRGRGIARALVSACIACARDDSAHVIGLFTSELMTDAQHLYESLGFHRECERSPRFGLRYWRYKLDLYAPHQPVRKETGASPIRGAPLLPLPAPHTTLHGKAGQPEK